MNTHMDQAESNEVAEARQQAEQLRQVVRNTQFFKEFFPVVVDVFAENTDVFREFVFASFDEFKAEVADPKNADDQPILWSELTAGSLRAIPSWDTEGVIIRTLFDHMSGIMVKMIDQLCPPLSSDAKLGDPDALSMLSTIFHDMEPEFDKLFLATLATLPNFVPADSEHASPAAKALMEDHIKLIQERVAKQVDALRLLNALKEMVDGFAEAAGEATDAVEDVDLPEGTFVHSPPPNVQ